jgi:hypothetical protein
VQHRDVRMFERDASRQLESIHDVWARWLGKSSRYRCPDRGLAVARVRDEVHARLDRIERRVDIDRDFSALEEMSLLPKLPAGVGPADDDLLELRQLSIRRAAANHAGQPASAAGAVANRLLRTGDAGAKDEVILYLNRVAVGHLNDLACSEALDVLADFVEWRHSVAILAPHGLAELGIKDGTLGALLGTQAQAMAMDAFAEQNLSQSAQAVETFLAARACFFELEDVDRQDTYRAHALIDRVRIGGELTDEEGVWLKRRVAATPVEAFTRAAAGSPFRVAFALKAHFLLKIPYAVDRVAQALLPELEALQKRGSGRLPHPYENIAGWLLRMNSCPRAIRSALEATAAGLQQPAPSVTDWIAQVFLDDAAGVPATVATGRLGAWSRRVEGRRALDALPFYYA